MSLSIYAKKLTQLKKNMDGVNRTLSRDICTVKEQLNNTDYYKIIPLFYYDNVEDIDLTGEGFFITDKTIIKYNSAQKNINGTVLTLAEFTGNLILWVTDTYTRPYMNAFVEIYTSTDGTDYILKGNARTDHTGQIIYEITDETYVKFIVNEEEIIWH